MYFILLVLVASSVFLIDSPGFLKIYLLIFSVFSVLISKPHSVIEFCLNVADYHC